VCVSARPCNLKKKKYVCSNLVIMQRYFTVGSTSLLGDTAM
jgi:hypothetical protein